MRADRLLSIMLLLQSRGRMTAAELAERLEVSIRTIYRDLEALGMAGIPLYTERGPGGGCELLDGYQTKLNGLTEMEIRALFLLNASPPLAALGLEQALEGALLKLSTALPADSRRDAEQVRQRIHVDHNPTPQACEPHLQIISEAVWRDRRVRIIYSSAHSHYCEQLVDPYGLVARAQVWYLVGAASGTLQIFRVSRIQTVEMTQECFERPPAFDLAGYWAEMSQSWMHPSANGERKKRGMPGYTMSSAQANGSGTRKKTHHLLSTSGTSNPERKKTDAVANSARRKKTNIANSANGAGNGRNGDQQRKKSNLKKTSRFSASRLQKKGFCLFPLLIVQPLKKEKTASRSKKKKALFSNSPLILQPTSILDTSLSTLQALAC